MLARGQRRTIVVVNRVKDLNKSDEEKVQIVSRDNQIELLSPWGCSLDLILMCISLLLIF